MCSTGADVNCLFEDKPAIANPVGMQHDWSFFVLTFQIQNITSKLHWFLSTT